MFEANPQLFPVGNEEIILRDYQLESIEQLRANIRTWNGAKGAQILASMVGSGKTVMAAHLLKECYHKQRPGLFVVDRLSLLGQTSAVFDRYGIPHGIIQSQHPRLLPDELIQVASLQTLKNLPEWPRADLIVIDECHCVYETATKKIDRKDAIIIGLSATPFTRGLGKYYSAIVNVRTGNQLTKDGYMVPFRVWAAREPDMKGCKTVAGEWTDKDASERAIRIVGDVVKEYSEHGEGRKSIAFGADVAHCEEMQRQFLHAGIDARLYTYRTDDAEREEILRVFRKPDSFIRILISVAALSRGFDVPDVGCILMARPLRRSFAEFVQTLGRGLRPFPGKANCHVLDLAGNFMRHHGELMRFFEEGCNELDDGKKQNAKQEEPKDKPPRKCPQCAFLQVRGLVCESCGYEFPKRATRAVHEDGDLRELTFDGSTVRAGSKSSIYIADIAKRYNPGHKPASPGFIEFIKHLCRDAGIELFDPPYTGSQLWRVKERIKNKRPDLVPDEPAKT